METTPTMSKYILCDGGHAGLCGRFRPCGRRHLGEHAERYGPVRHDGDVGSPTPWRSAAWVSAAVTTARVAATAALAARRAPYSKAFGNSFATIGVEGRRRAQRERLLRRRPLRRFGRELLGSRFGSHEHRNRRHRRRREDPHHDLHHQGLRRWQQLGNELLSDD